MTMRVTLKGLHRDYRIEMIAWCDTYHLNYEIEGADLIIWDLTYVKIVGRSFYLVISEQLHEYTEIDHNLVREVIVD